MSCFIVMSLSWMKYCYFHVVDVFYFVGEAYFKIVILLPNIIETQVNLNQLLIKQTKPNPKNPPTASL